LLPSKHEHDCHEHLGQVTHCEHSFVEPGALQIGPPPVPVPPVVVLDPVPVDPAPPAPVVPPPVVVVPGGPTFADWLQSGGGVHGVPQ
jgi:hypothetical protein